MPGFGVWLVPKAQSNVPKAQSNVQTDAVNVLPDTRMRTPHIPVAHGRTLQQAVDLCEQLQEQAGTVEVTIMANDPSYDGLAFVPDSQYAGQFALGYACRVNRWETIVGLSKANVLGLGKVSYTAFYPVAYSCSIWTAARETRRVVKTYDQPMRKLLFEPVLANLCTRDPNAFAPMTLHQAEAMLDRAE